MLQKHLNINIDKNLKLNNFYFIKNYIFRF
jgi:hypothetical protein